MAGPPAAIAAPVRPHARIHIDIVPEQDSDDLIEMHVDMRFTANAAQSTFTNLFLGLMRPPPRAEDDMVSLLRIRMMTDAVAGMARGMPPLLTPNPTQARVRGGMNVVTPTQPGEIRLEDAGNGTYRCSRCHETIPLVDVPAHITRHREPPTIEMREVPEDTSDQPPAPPAADEGVGEATTQTLEAPHEPPTETTGGPVGGTDEGVQAPEVPPAANAIPGGGIT